jgi:hypothetical protein
LLFLVVHTLISEAVVLLRDVEQIAAQQGGPDRRSLRPDNRRCGSRLHLALIFLAERLRAGVSLIGEARRTAGGFGNDRT